MLNDGKLTRREFLHTSALVAAGAAVTACSRASPAPVEEEEVPTATSKPVEKETVPTATPQPAVTPPDKESPMMTALVEAGSLPPLDERLPANPRICPTIEAIGEYSELWQVSGTSSPAQPLTYILMPGMFGETNDGELFADYAESLEMSDDAKVCTFRFRAGLKWSDGVPFTTEDVKFWYEDDFLNTEINPMPPQWGWTPGGHVPELKIIDDYAFSLSWPVPNRPLMYTLRFWAGMWWNFATGTPAHYMKQFHKEYNADVEKEAKDEGYDSWVQYYGARKNLFAGTYAEYKPVLSTLVLEEQPQTHITYQRNPYYWGVDKEGNQLPYFDRARSVRVENSEMFLLKVLAGEVDYAPCNLIDMPALQKSAEDGNYLVHEYKNPMGSAISFCFNRTFEEDPVLGEIFQDPRWSKAMSYAINREEMKEVLFMGSGECRQAAPNPDCSYFKEEWDQAYAEYNPDKAEQLLDEMGLDKQGPDGYRLRPDGEPLSVHVDLCFQSALDAMKLVAEYWEAVGVKISYQMIQRELFETRGRANQIACGVWGTDRTNEARAYVPGTGKIIDDYVQYEMPCGNEWFRWYRSGGEEGIEPPEEWKQHYGDIDAWHTCASQEEYIRLAQAIFDFLVLDQLRVIGTVGFPTIPVVVQKDLGNFPDEGFMGDDVGGCRSLNPEAWYRKKT